MLLLYKLVGLIERDKTYVHNNEIAISCLKWAVEFLKMPKPSKKMREL